jgi:hypothetical protein
MTETEQTIDSSKNGGIVLALSVLVGLIALRAFAVAPCKNNIATDHLAPVCGTNDGYNCTDSTFTQPIGCTAPGTCPDYDCAGGTCGIVFETDTDGICGSGVCDASRGTTTFQKKTASGSTCYPTTTTYQCQNG